MPRTTPLLFLLSQLIVYGAYASGIDLDTRSDSQSIEGADEEEKKAEPKAAGVRRKTKEVENKIKIVYIFWFSKQHS